MLELLSEPIGDMELVLNEATESGVKVWFKFYQDEHKHYVTITRYVKLFTQRYTFTIKGTIDRYMAFISDLEMQMRIDSGIETYERPVDGSRVSLMYLRYKKILLMDSRDFLYIKYQEEQHNKLIEVSKSIEIPDFKPK